MYLSHRANLYIFVLNFVSQAEPEVSSYSARQNSSAGTKPNLTDNDVVYSTIQ